MLDSLFLFAYVSKKTYLCTVIDVQYLQNMSPIYSRTELLLGSQAMNSLAEKRVIIFGVGGVGSWCAEALVRSGITHLTMVDNDLVAISNINRQLPATSSTIGQPKVEVMRRRLMEINPEAEIVARQQRYSADTAASYDLEGYDYVIDAIDSLQDKANLILHATSLHVRLFSSMGAALKSDPSRIRVAEFWKVNGCPLAAALRRRFRKAGNYPSAKFSCVYSDELLQNRLTNHDEPRANGTLIHITAVFGLTLASMVIRDAAKE